jgi:hypothetical protein
MYSNEHAMSNAVSISITDPRDISKKRLLSAADFLDAPSAIFKWTDTAARRICCIIAKRSLQGKELVACNTLTKAILNFDKHSTLYALIVKTYPKIIFTTHH